MPGDSLYMFALMPPAELAARIHAIRTVFSERFGFKAAMKPPVHITMLEPFVLHGEEPDKFEQQVAGMKRWGQLQKPFMVALQNFSFFDNPRAPVVFIDVVKDPGLRDLHTSFLREVKKYVELEPRKNGFNPHITIGYRDVTPEAFPEIKMSYSKQKFSASFECHTLYLWKHNGKNWEVEMEFPLTQGRDQMSLF